jgi:hypothetical protein
MKNQENVNFSMRIFKGLGMNPFYIALTPNRKRKTLWVVGHFTTNPMYAN